MKKVGIVIFQYPLGSSALLSGSALLLARAGYEVHVFIDKPGFERSGAKFKDKNIIMHQIEDTVTYRSGIWRQKIPVFHNGKFKKVPAGDIYLFLRKKILIGLYKLYLPLRSRNLSTFRGRLYQYTSYFFSDLFDFSQRILKYADSEYSFVIGVEPRGLVAASIFAIDKKIPVIYYNMELLLENEYQTTEQKFLKRLERECSRESAFTVIGDEKRARHLMVDNGLLEDKVLCIPVSTLGEPYTRKSDYLHRTLSIPRDKRIILYAGNIIEWSMSLEIAQAAQKWADDIVLVLHTWRPEAREEPYVKQIIALTESKKVYLSLAPLKLEELPELLSSADIGLIFYKNLGPNYYETASSSNKMAQYLQAGLPVITSNFPSFREIVESYKCGRCADSPAEIEMLAREIFSDYESYRDNAFKCYQGKYDLSKHFNRFLDKMRGLTSNHN